jgi:hypothetical protein
VRRWKKFLHNTISVLADLRVLLMEFHVLIAMLMLIVLALLEVRQVVSRVAHWVIGPEQFRPGPSTRRLLDYSGLAPVIATSTIST